MANTFRVKGQVRDLHGVMQPHARIKFVLRNTTFGVNFVVPAHQSDFITGPDGFFQADLIEGEYTVAVSFDGKPSSVFPLNIPEGKDGFIEIVPFGGAKILSEGTITLTGTGPVTATFVAPSVTGSPPINVTLVSTLVADVVTVTGAAGNGTATGLELAAVPQSLAGVWTVQADVGDPATSTATVTLPAYTVPAAMVASVPVVLSAMAIRFPRPDAPFDGGTAILSYRFYHSVNGTPQAVQNDVGAQVDLTGLTAGDVVVGEFRAVNAAGESLPGATATAQTWQLPAAPLAGTLASPNPGEVVYTWPATPNLFGRDLIREDYIIYDETDTQIGSGQRSGGAATTTISAAAGVGRYVRSNAVTDAGAGSYSPPSNAVTVAASGVPVAGATAITFANAGNLFSRTDPLFDVGAFDGNNAATAVFSLTATTGEPVYVRLKDESDNVVPVNGQAFTLLGNGTGSVVDYSLSDVAWHPDLLTPEFYMAAGTWQASPRSFQAGSRIIFWTQSLGAREQSEGNAVYNLAAQPPLDGTIAERINCFTRSGYTEGISEAKPTVAVRTPITSTGIVANQTSSVSAMADTLHSIAPTHRYEVVMQAISGSNWDGELTDDTDTNRKWSNEVQVHNLAVSDKNPGGLIVWSWIYTPSGLGVDYTSKFLAFAFGTAGVGTASTYDHTLTELYGDYSVYKLAHDMPILCGETYRPDNGLVGTTWTSSIKGSDGANMILAFNRENVAQQVRTLHTQATAVGKMLPPLANTAGFLCGNNATNGGDFIHPGYTADTGVDGQQRFMRGHALKAAEALGLFSGPGRVEFTDAVWDYAGNTVTITARNEVGAAVPVTSLRALLSESQPAGRPAYHTDNLVGFEVADANSITTVSGYKTFNIREIATPTINGSGQVVVSFAGTGVDSIPNHRKRVIFGGGLGFGNREQVTDFTNEMWKDNAVVGFTSPDGVIRERPVSPFPDPALLTTYTPQTALENLFDRTPNVWTDYNTSEATLSGDRSALVFTDTSGNGSASFTAHILNDVLTQWESGGSFTFSFWSDATNQILIRAANEADGTRTILYNSTGGHGSAGSPVTLTTAFPFNIGALFRVRLQILCTGMAANGTTTINAITPTWTPA